MKSRGLFRGVASLTCALLGLAGGASMVRAATVVVVNNNAAGVGFNDPTPATPVGGNTGTTVGAQRLIAFQAAADVWGARLSSAVPIRVGAQFTPLSCSATSGVLGSAGPNAGFRDFTGAPVAGTFYAVALANALHGSDLDTANDDISANFNSNLGTTGCLTNSGWYYGLDSNPPAGTFDFMTVLIHELGHGLGFLTFVDLTTGAKASGFNDAFMLNLENHGASPPDYPSMSNAQRVAASVATGNLHWTGANVRAASGVLTAGAVGDHVRMYAPNPAQSGSSVSHWDTVATPNQIMEPSYTQALHTPVLELAAFRDIGWTVAPTWAIQGTGDANADGKSDIFWQNSSGDALVWFMNGAAISSFSVPGSVPSGWSIAKTGDFNGDGKTDILWRNVNGDVVIWLMNGGSILSSAYVASVPATWTIAGVGDFNGDGKSDILWKNTTGDVIIWTMNGTSIASSNFVASVPTNWSIAGVGNFNADNKADVLWKNTAGDVVIWLMNGSTIAASSFVASVPTNWSIAGVGNFNGDAFSDILWENTGGDVVIWTMNGPAIAAANYVSTIPLTYSIAGTGDFNGDGKSDVLFRSVNGDVVIWFMNGATIASSALAGTVPSSAPVQSASAN